MSNNVEKYLLGIEAIRCLYEDMETLDEEMGVLYRKLSPVEKEEVRTAKSAKAKKYNPEDEE